MSTLLVHTLGTLELSFSSLKLYIQYTYNTCMCLNACLQARLVLRSTEIIHIQVHYLYVEMSILYEVYYFI